MNDKAFCSADTNLASNPVQNEEKNDENSLDNLYKKLSSKVYMASFVVGFLWLASRFMYSFFGLMTCLTFFFVGVSGTLYVVYRFY